METVFIFIVIILVASILQTSTGFGFSILATPFLLLIFDAREAIQINLILSLVISCALIYKIRKDIDFEALKRLVIGSVIGLPLGMVIFLLLDMNKLRLAISIIILLLTLLLIFNVRIRQTKGRDLTAGSLSGLLTTSIGMPGPPLLLYFSGINSKKEKLRATTLAFYLFIYFFSLLIQATFAGTNKTIWISSGYALPFVVGGLYLGQLLFAKINQHVFRIFTYIILLFTGIHLLVESLK
ncbi:sulfite exporter TauE/SafE family protein [Bacillus sp. FJAT-49711]|uniref:sulfite exporter TauE/SafE family protein n=1 Tax=Bacillus sp. FJAT-49711 TaxID=2833585 RepID=UPI001BC90878|nr:sulfite exporter TauE/SafE family protein [Bacillus sp. FJAT-49711]MBS4218591.1 sulfite exporter TauE/SafE family protein [Bacillus sp. FJAT-49711]